jgi:hypothetical protein
MSAGSYVMTQLDGCENKYLGRGLDGLLRRITPPCPARSPSSSAPSWRSYVAWCYDVLILRSVDLQGECVTADVCRAALNCVLCGAVRVGADGKVSECKRRWRHIVHSPCSCVRRLLTLAARAHLLHALLFLAQEYCVSVTDPDPLP